MTADNKLETLYAELDELEIKEKELIKETDETIAKAKKLIEKPSIEESKTKSELLRLDKPYYEPFYELDQEIASYKKSIKLFKKLIKQEEKNLEILDSDEFNFLKEREIEFLTNSIQSKHQFLLKLHTQLGEAYQEKLNLLDEEEIELANKTKRLLRRAKKAIK